MSEHHPQTNPLNVARFRLTPLRVLLAVLALLAGLFMFAAVAGIEVDASPYRSAVSRWLSEQLGRHAQVDGEFRLRLGMRPALRVKDLRLAQPP